MTHLRPVSPRCDNRRVHVRAHAICPLGLGHLHAPGTRSTSVVANVSRSMFAVAEKLFPGVDIYTLLVTASEDTLRQRLTARKRESPAEIEERIRQALSNVPQGSCCQRVRGWRKTGRQAAYAYMERNSHADHRQGGGTLPATLMACVCARASTSAGANSDNTKSPCSAWGCPALALARLVLVSFQAARHE